MTADRFPITALVMTLLGWVGEARADAFVAVSGDNRVAFTCDGTAVVDTACRIEIRQGASSETTPVRFTAQPTRYAHLLKVGIERAIESNQPAFRLNASDISLLRGLALDKCHPAVDHSGDLLQLCVPADSSSVVLFKRDVCDRCDFEPIVLRKQTAPSSSSSTTALPPRSTDRSEANTEVRIQVCVPTQRIYFNDLQLDQLENHPAFTKYSQQQLALAPKTIRRVAPSTDPRAANDPRVVRSYGVGFGEVLKRSGQFSDSAGFMPVKDSTVADQPVYEKGYGHPAGDYVAMHLRLPNMERGPEGRVTYWFKLPKTIPVDAFTDWFAPVSMETEQTGEKERRAIWWKLTHGGDLTIYPVSANPPKMRVMLHKRRAQHDDPTSDSLPALTTARRRLRTATSGPQFAYEFVAKSDEAIPKCD